MDTNIMKKITTNLINKIRDIEQPFNTDDSVYLYLLEKQFINFKYSYFKNIMSTYKTMYKKEKPTNDTNTNIKQAKLSTVEQAFCEAVEHLKTKTIYSVYKSLYEQSLDDPDVALKFLKLYDRKEKKYDEMIKGKNIKNTLNNTKAHNTIDNGIIERNISEINLLIQNAQEPNKINIQRVDSYIDNSSDNNNQIAADK